MIITARHTMLAASTALVVALAAVPVGAQDFIIDGTFEGPGATNGDFADLLIVDGASVLVTEGSSIDVTTDPRANAIRVRGDNVTIEVRGALASQAGLAGTPTPDSNGIYVVGTGATLLLTETGSITTYGDDALGQYQEGDDGTITNNGTIITRGVGGDGQIINGNGGTITNASTIMTESAAASGQVIFGNDGTIINTGTIMPGGKVSLGQTINGDDGTLTNTGTIMTEGESSFGQYIFGDDGTLTNTGTIMTGGEYSFGQFYVGNGGTITNIGMITTTGENADGQRLYGDGSTFINSGRLVSRQAAAIRIDDTMDNNTINLLAPGFVGGAIDFGDEPGNGAGPPTNTTVNIVTGMSQSILWTLEGDMVGGAPDISGSVPWFYNAATQTVATFDPTLLASETAALGDLTSMLSRVGLGALDGFEPGPGPDTGFSALGYMPVADGEADTATHRVGRAWATALGGQMDHEGGGTTLDSTIGHIGVAAGYTWQQAPDLILNAMAGYVAGNNKADANWAPSFDHDTHTLFAGLHGEHQLNRAAVQFGLTAGHSWVDHNRFVNDNLAPLGESWVSADYGGFFVSPELGVSTDVALANGVVVTPNAGLRYAAQWLGGYTETGAVSAAANATVADRFVGVFEGRIGLDARHAFDFGTLTGRIGYLGRWGGGDDDASVTLNGVTQSVASGHQDLNAVTVGATLRSDVGETGFLELDATYLVGDTAHGFDGRLTMGMAF